jgi:membrane protein
MQRVPSVRDVHRGVEEHDVLTYASAIAFQVLTALVPLLLVLLALIGFFDLERVWQDAARELRPNLSDAAFTVVDDTVRNVLSGQQWFWLTAGLAFALWRLSAAMRAVMGALDRIYDAERERTLAERLRVSIGLAIAVALLLLAALSVVHLGPLVVSVDGVLLGAVSFVVRWGLAGLLLLLAVGLTIHHAPATPQPLGWVSFGSLSAVGAWLAGSALFVLYVTEVASYGSLFGSLATIFVLLTYLYLSAIALLVGVEIDTQVRRRVEGSPDGAGAERGEGEGRLSGARAAA